MTLAARRLRLAVVFLAAAGPAVAVVPEDLYSGTVVVEGTPPAEAELVRTAFDALLVKLTDPVTLAAARAAAPDQAALRTMVSSVSYLDGGGGTGAPALDQSRVVARFEPAAVDAWLMRRSLPRWQPERQRWLLWLVFDEAAGRRLLRAADSEIRAAVQSAAANAGLPIEIPGDDALPAAGSLGEERLIAAIRGGYPEDPIFRRPPAAGGAPQQDVFVAQSLPPILVTARPMQGGWQVRWRALAGNDLLAFATGDSDLAVALAAGAGRFAGEIARRHLLRDTTMQMLVVEIAGLDSPRAVGEALAQLGSLSQVESLAVSAARGDRLSLELRARAGYAWLRSALDLETDWVEVRDWAAPDIGDSGVPQRGAGLRYRVGGP